MVCAEEAAGEEDADTEEESRDGEHDDSDSESTACTEEASSSDDDEEEEEVEEPGKGSKEGAEEEAALCGRMAELAVGAKEEQAGKPAAAAGDQAGDRQGSDTEPPRARELLTGEEKGERLQSLFEGLLHADVRGRPSGAEGSGPQAAASATSRPLIQELP